MGSVGAPEILVILVLALLVLGPDRLPQAARTAGRWMGELRKITSSLQAEVQTVVDEVMQPVQTTAAAATDAYVATAPAAFTAEPATTSTPSDGAVGTEDPPVTAAPVTVGALPPFDPSLN
jgi:sec-independent protein translocase protein TatB